jgi:glutamyl-tRNA synthetase
MRTWPRATPRALLRSPPAHRFLDMADDTFRVRFAPSPTGYLHVGGARTALFNWLLARRHGGSFVLRIEDTDRERSDDAMTRVILDALTWLGLDWDEGPFHQADGLERHRTDALALLSAGAAYRCFCTQAELEVRREQAGGDAFRYDRRCLTGVAGADAERRAAAGEPHTVRFRVPDGATAWDDAVHGEISFDNDAIEDFILLRSDGTPTYNLAVVSDDVHMRITHVIRGDDHISNTPKQILLYRALDHTVPTFGHVPLILGPDGKRLSKRHGATAVGEYRAQGILPSAMVNFLALLGWSPGTDEEIFDTDELVARFSIEGINRKSAVFDVQKLFWLNGQHINRMAADEIRRLVRAALAEAGLADADPRLHDDDWLDQLVDLLRPRARSIQDIVAQARPLLADAIDYDAAAVAKHWKDAAVADRLEGLRQCYADSDDWTIDALERMLRERAEQNGVGAGKLIHPLRVALTGQAVSPGIFEVAAVMGRARVLARIDAALSVLAQQASGSA